jgi:hypothetical protein
MLAIFLYPLQNSGWGNKPEESNRDESNWKIDERRGLLEVCARRTGTEIVVMSGSSNGESEST